MSDAFKMMIKEYRSSMYENFLVMTMDDLIVCREELFKNEYIRQYEEKYILGGMKDSDGLCQETPSPSYWYFSILDEISCICRVMEYKLTCMYRWGFRKDFHKIDEKTIIQKIRQAIKYNPYIKYEKLIELDLALDIDVVLEYLIDTKQLINVQADRYTKHGNRKWKWNDE